jgi:hypothetical protein
VLTTVSIVTRLNPLTRRRINKGVEKLWFSNNHLFYYSVINFCKMCHIISLSCEGAGRCEGVDGEAARRSDCAACAALCACVADDDDAGAAVAAGATTTTTTASVYRACTTSGIWLIQPTIAAAACTASPSVCRVIKMTSATTTASGYSGSRY